jgi:hypothetical protein
MAQVPTGWWYVDTALRTHARDDRGERSALRESACFRDGVEHALEVIGILEVGGMDSGWVPRIGGSQANPAA